MSKKLYPVLLLSALVCTFPAAAAWKAVLFNHGFKYPLCDSKETLSDMAKAMANEDTDMMMFLTSNHNCTTMAKKEIVDVMDQSTLGGWAKVALTGDEWAGSQPAFTVNEVVHKPGHEDGDPNSNLDSNTIGTQAPTTKDDGHSPIEWPPLGPLTNNGFYPINSGPFVIAKDHPELVKKGMSLFMSPIHTADKGKEAVFSGIISGFKKTAAFSMAGESISRQKCDAFQVNDDPTSWECLSDLKGSDLYYFRMDDPNLTGREVIKHQDSDDSDEYTPLTEKPSFN